MPRFLVSRFFAYTFVFTLFTFAPFMPQAQAQTKNSVPAAEIFINQAADDIIDILTTSTSQSDREKRFAKLLKQKADLRRMGRFALGQFARKVSKQDFAAYQKLLETLIIKVYSNRMGAYSDEKIIITESQQKKRNVVVKSQIIFANGRPPIALDWWLVEQKRGGYRLFDIRVLGVWLVQEQRDSFSSVLKNNKGNFQALLDHLQKLVKSGTAQEAAQTNG